jgi:hypothetical protein
MSSNHDAQAILLLSLLFGGFIVAAGAATPTETNLIAASTGDNVMVDLISKTAYSETLTVNTLGQVFIDGNEIQAIGLHLEHSSVLPSNAIANSMLDKLQTAGIRFMALNIPYWLQPVEWADQIDFWMPKLFAHKMWVQLQPQHDEPEPPVLDADVQMVKHQAIIDRIDANSDWGSIVFSWCGAWELDDAAFSFTNVQVDTYLTAFIPKLAAALALTSNIGSVPIFNKPQSPYDNSHGTYQLGTTCDLTGMDYYYTVTAAGSGDFTATVQTRMDDYFSTYLVDVGKTNQYAWWTELGIMNYGLNSEWSPTLFQEYLGAMTYGKMALGMFWVMWGEAANDYRAFNVDGSIKPWFNALLPYIPEAADPVLLTPSYSALSLSDGSIDYDESVTCSATVTGAGAMPTGTLTFYYSLDSTLTWHQIGGAKTLDAAGSATSNGFTPVPAGNYLVYAIYSGDTIYTDLPSLPLTLTVASPSTSTNPPLGVLGKIITAMEKANVGDSYWDRGLWEDGMWEHDTPMINLRTQMEKM